MKNKLLVIIAAIFIFSSSAFAKNDVKGNYNGTVKIALSEMLSGVGLSESLILGMLGLTEMPTFPAVVTITEPTADSYTLGLPFNVDEIEIPEDFKKMIGELEISGVTATDYDETITYFAKTTPTEGPFIVIDSIKTPLFDDSMKATLKTVVGDYLEFQYKFNEGYVSNISSASNKKLFASIDLQLKLGLLGFQSLLKVTFGDNGSTSIDTYINNTLDIYTSPASDIITVVGSVNENYSIYNTNGALIQTGYIQNEQVNISNITSGMYFIKVDNKTAKFIK
ncbi:T9SS type A sorting domain-containing protein [Paludibacteraceae bacterium OttesenSCG-928-F17]|nr:T9SS type A sorting domain-containing protein [Paludibacteraceae bacterium OttesenSCG-928-F17]